MTKGDSLIMENKANVHCEKWHNLDWSTLQLHYNSEKWKKIVPKIKTLQKTESATSRDGWYKGRTNFMWALKGWHKHGLLLLKFQQRLQSVNKMFCA